jgi:hypothetical protein
MKTYRVAYVRIEHQVYYLEVCAENEEQAEEIAEDQFTGDENYEVVHAEEFINQIDEIEVVL